MLNLFNLLADAEGTKTQPDYTMWIIIGVLVIGFIVMNVINNKKQKKQAAEEAKKKDALCAGTKIITIGGIVGTVVSVSDENYTLKTGDAVLELDKRSIYQMTLPAKVQAKLDAEKAETAKPKKEKKVKEVVEEVKEEVVEEVKEEIAE